MKKIIYLLLITVVSLCSCIQNNKLFRIEKDGLYGFIDSLGNVIIEPQYTYVGKFCSGYACIISSITMSRDSIVKITYGYINTRNELVIDTVNTIKSSVEDKRLFEKFNKRDLGFRIDISMLDLRDDRYVYQDPISKHYGYKNSEGEISIKAKYDYANSFSHGRAIVRDTLNFEKDKDSCAMTNREGIIDKYGKLIVKPEYGYISSFYNNATWASFVRKDNNNIIREWVLIDKNGKVLIPPFPMEFVHNSNEGLYVVEGINSGMGYYTWIDSKGNFISDFNHDGELRSNSKFIRTETFGDVTAFSDGFAGIRATYTTNQPAWFFFNKELRSNYIPYDSLLPFSEGVAAVKEFIPEDNGHRSGKWGFIDAHAQITIPYQFSECGLFRGGLAYFKNCGSTYDIEGYINKNGKIVWQTKCKKIKRTSFRPSHEIIP